MFQTWEQESDPARGQRLAAAFLAASVVLAGLFTLAVVLPPGALERKGEPAVVVAFRPPPPLPVPEPKKIELPPQPKAARPKPPPPVARVEPPPAVPAPAAAPMVAPKQLPTERPPEAPAAQAVPERVVEVGGTGDGSGNTPGGGAEEAESPAPVVASLGSTGPVNLPEDADPAEPSDGNALPDYPEAARTSGQEAVVVLKIVIEANGRVGQIQVMKGEEPFVGAALEAVRGWTYEPARLEGRAISIFKIIKLPFRLRND